MSVKTSVTMGGVPSISVVASLLSTSETSIKNGKVIVTISNGDIVKVDVRHSTPKVKIE